MIKFLTKSAAMVMLTLLISASAVLASGKMEVMIGDRVDLTADSKLASPQYKWVVSKGTAILDTQTGKIFSYQFDSQGEYTINLTAISGSVIESTSINVMTGDKYEAVPSPSEGDVGNVITGKGGEVIGTIGEGGVVLGETGEVVGKIDETTGAIVANDGQVIAEATEAKIADVSTAGILKLILTTLPPMDSENRVTLLGDGKVQFSLDQSYSEIIEYRIDKNIYQDSDGNGIANDDIDNSGDNSYLTGSSWSADYKKGETPKIAAEVTLVGKNGKKAKKQAEILFKEPVTTGDPKAVLEVLPASDPKDGLVHLYNDPHKVSFYARASEGKILEYRIDRNIFEDSDSNGDSKDDIDNIKDISFKTGDVFETEYKKTDAQIIAQLIVVGEVGKGSRVQKELIFGEKPKPPAPTLKDMEEAGGIRLTADKDYVIKGDPIKFSVKGLQLEVENYTFDWDFDGDGTVDKTTEGVDNIDYIFDVPGVFNVKVTITDKEGNKSDKTLEIISKDTQVTKSDFSYVVDGNTVTFTDLSNVAYNLSNKQLEYNWSFGDTDTTGFEKQIDQVTLQNPVYTYNLKGKYLVTLTITDADKVSDSRSAELEIAQDLVTDTITTPTEITTTDTEKTAGEGGSLFLKILKILLYLILIVIVLVLLIVSGFLVFLKIQHPQLTFEELIDEFKVKILTMIGAHEMPPDRETPPSGPTPRTSEAPASSSGSEAGEAEEVIHPEVEPMPVQTGPVPDWLKGTEVIEGEAEPVSNDETLKGNDQIPNPNDQLTGESDVNQPAESNEEPTEQAPTEEIPTEESVPAESSEETMPTESTVGEEMNSPSEVTEPETNDQSSKDNDQSSKDNDQIPMTTRLRSQPSANDQFSGESVANQSEETPEEEIPSEEPSTELEETPADTEETLPVEPAGQTPAPSAVPPVLGPDGLPLRKKKRRRRHKKKNPQSDGTPGQPQRPAPQFPKPPKPIV